LRLTTWRLLIAFERRHPAKAATRISKIPGSWPTFG